MGVKFLVHVALDFHEAGHTEAMTVWYVSQGFQLVPIDELLPEVMSDRSDRKTHWVSIFDVPVGWHLVRVRRSNAGNYHVQIFKVTKDGLKQVSEFSGTEAMHWLLQRGFVP